MHSKKSSIPEPLTPVTNSRGFRLVHQIINVTDIDFKKRSIGLNVQLHFIPQNPSKPARISLNCQQLCVIKLLVNKKDAKFTYIDPSLEVCYNNKNRRDVKYFSQSNRENVFASDLDLPHSVGELIITVPQSEIHASDVIKINIECKLDKPKGGIQFIIPHNASLTESNALPQGCHMYTSSLANNARLWLPCVDSYSELCTWEINICCPSSCFAISVGELVDHKFMIETKRKIFKYQVNTPTSAPNIGLAVGTFEVYPDPVNPHSTYFYLPGVFPILEHTVAFLPRVYDYLHDIFNISLPFPMHKIVFVSDCTPQWLSYSSFTICNIDLLHPRQIIDQAIETRKDFIRAVTTQYFGCFLTPASWNDYWIIHGISGFASGLIFKSVFGTNEYNYWIKDEIESLEEFYSQQKASMFPLYASSEPLPTFGPSPKGDKNQPSLNTNDLFHPSLATHEELTTFHRRAYLVMRMLSLRIGKEILLKVIHKMLALGSQGSKGSTPSEWSMMLVSTFGFVRLISTVSGKDITSFLHNWVCSSAIPRLHISYTFNRRKNSLEVEVKQESNSNTKSKFTGPLAIVVQEIDTFYLHTIPIEDVITRHEIPFHSKLKRTKRKQKCILYNGLEIEVDLTTSELEYPLLWVRPDPQLYWLSRITVDQPTLMWMNLLKHDRDVISQRESINALTKGMVKDVIPRLVGMLLNINVFYRVRILCIKCLIRLFNQYYYDDVCMSMIEYFYKLYGSKEVANIVAPNDFSNFGNYFLQKEMPPCIAGLRNLQKQTPKEVLHFLLDLLRYNENTANDYSDDYYIASLVDAMSHSLTLPLSYLSNPNTTLTSSQHFSSLSKEIKEIVKAIVHLLNIEKLLPSYKFVITCSCLATIRLFQAYFFIPTNLSFFYSYLDGHYSEVQYSALNAIIDIISSQQEIELFEEFLNHTESNEMISFRSKSIQLLTTNPPFVKKKTSKLNTPDLVERLWNLMNLYSAFNPQIRVQLSNLYLVLYGRVTPSCLPQSLGVVIDLKEKTAHSSLHPD